MKMSPFQNLKSILAGWAVATPLMWLMWRSVGALYSQSMPWRDGIEHYLLFWGPLMPDTLAIAFAAGVFVGLVPGKGRLMVAHWRGAAAALLFAVILGPAIFELMWVTSSVGSQVRELISLPTMGLMLVFAAPFSVIAGYPFICAAPAGAAVGGWDSILSKRARFALACACLCAAAGLTVFHGVSVRRVINSFEDKLPIIDEEVEGNLVRVPRSAGWHVRMSKSWLPTAKGAFCQFKEVTVSVDTTTSGRLHSAHLGVTLPSTNRLPSKQSAEQMLRSYGVRESMIARISRNYGAWTADNGKFSLYVAPWRG